MPTLSDLFNLDPNVERLSLLPRMRGSLPSEKSVMMPDRYMPDVIAPKILYDFIRAIKAPGRAARGEVLDEEEALNVATNVMGGGMLSSGGAPAGSLGMFIGPKSSLWNKQAANRALEMEAAGANPADIWRETMTARGLDKQLRQEISDAKAKFLPEKLPEMKAYSEYVQDFLESKGIKTDPDKTLASQVDRNILDEAFAYAKEKENRSIKGVGLPSALQHEQLADAYPNLFYNLSVAKEPYGTGARGRFLSSERKVTTGGSGTMTNVDQARSTLLHEIQHAIQEKENWGRGGSPEYAKSIANASIRAETAPLVEAFSINRHHWNEYGKAARSEYMLRLSDIANRENIKPRTIYNLQDWYKYGNEYRNQAGPQPKKPGPARDAWFQGAADYIRQQNIKTDPRYQGLPFDNVRDAKNAQKRAMTQIKKTDEATQKYRELGEKQKRFTEMSDLDAYYRLAGEAESRLTQTRENLSMEQRREHFPFSEQYEKPFYGTSVNPAPYGAKTTVNPYGLDVPAKETISYTQFGQSFQPQNDPLMQFLGSTAPVDDPLMRFLFAPQGK